MCRWNVTICACGFAWVANPPAQPCRDWQPGGQCRWSREYAANLDETSVALGQYEIPPDSECPHVQTTRIDLKVAGYRLAAFTMSKTVNSYAAKRTGLIYRYNTVASHSFDSQNPHHVHAASVVDAQGAASQQLSYLLTNYANAVLGLSEFSTFVQNRNKFWVKDNPTREYNKLSHQKRVRIEHQLREKFTDAVVMMGPIEANLIALGATIDKMTVAPSVHSGNSNSPSRAVDGNAVGRLNIDAQAFAHQLDPNLIPPPTTYTEGAIYRESQPLFVVYYPPPPPAPVTRTYGNTGNTFLDADFDDLEDEQTEMHGTVTTRGFMGIENVNDGFAQIHTSEDDLPEIPAYEDFAW